ncbi:hypothetical protein ACF1BN_20525 [Streptomyces sp. NPDC014861]|uniref:hypothetical protein n=1 Tax=Streptomyces sp. NPDC014861 TaxID=3364923 RepID=UPI0036F6133A
MDDNEVRAARAAGQDAASISLPAVAWQQAGEDPGGEPGRKPEAGTGGERDGEGGGGAVTGAVAPAGEPGRRPEAESGGKPDGESGGGAVAGTVTPEPVAGAVAPEPVAEAGDEPESPATPPAASSGAASSGAAPDVPATGVAGDDAEAGTGTTGSGTIGAEDAPEGASAAAAQAAGAAGEGARDRSRPTRRLSKPMIAAAATSGVVLLGVPLLLSQVGGGSGSGPGSLPPRPTGYSQADGGPGGFVPRADAPEKGSVLPGKGLAPGTTSAPGKTSPVAGKAPLATSVAGVGVGVGAGPAPTSSEAPTDSRAPASAGAPGSSRAPASSRAPGAGQSPRPTSAGGGSAPTTAPAAPRETTAPPRKPATQAPPPPPAKERYSALAGPNCAGGGASFTYSGWYTDGKEGWQKYGSGGHTGDGCDGSFLSLPMSGKAGSDAGNALRWTFRTGGVTSGTCQVSVHIPNNGDIKAVGGKPAYYTVHAGATGSDPILRSFNVDQPSRRGQWVSAGDVRVTGGVLTVKLHDRGLDWSGSQKTYAHHAGDAARVQCTSA